MPVPAIARAISAPATPVSAAKRPGSENTPAPTIDPTTMAVRVNRPTFAVGGDVRSTSEAAACDMPSLRVAGRLGPMCTR